MDRLPDGGSTPRLRFWVRRSGRSGQGPFARSIRDDMGRLSVTHFVVRSGDYLVEARIALSRHVAARGRPAWARCDRARRGAGRGKDPAVVDLIANRSGAL